MAVGIFTMWQVLLYVARDRDTDEQALHAAHRRGIELPPEVLVKRPDQPMRKYKMVDGVPVLQTAEK